MQDSTSCESKVAVVVPAVPVLQRSGYAYAHQLWRFLSSTVVPFVFISRQSSRVFISFLTTFKTANMGHQLDADTEDFLMFVVRNEFARLTKERHDKKIFNTQVLFLL